MPRAGRPVARRRRRCAPRRAAGARLPRFRGRALRHRRVGTRRRVRRARVPLRHARAASRPANLAGAPPCNQALSARGVPAGARGAGRDGHLRATRLEPAKQRGAARALRAASVVRASRRAMADAQDAQHAGRHALQRLAGLAPLHRRRPHRGRASEAFCSTTWRSLSPERRLDRLDGAVRLGSVLALEIGRDARGRGRRPQRAGAARWAARSGVRRASALGTRCVYWPARNCVSSS